SDLATLVLYTPPGTPVQTGPTASRNIEECRRLRRGAPNVGPGELEGGVAPFARTVGGHLGAPISSAPAAGQLGFQIQRPPARPPAVGHPPRQPRPAARGGPGL